MAHTKTFLLGGLCAAALMATTAHAQDAASAAAAPGDQSAAPPMSDAQPQAADNGSAQSGETADIIVTARKVSENSQRVPNALTVITPDKLAKTDIKDVASLARITPGLQILGQGGSNDYPRVRGLPGVVTYFDGVPSTLDGLGGFSLLFDVENVQILQGPQGTLFGLASNAGAVQTQPRRPGDTFGGFVNVSYGSYNRQSIEGAVDVPLAGDRLLFRIAGQKFYRRGWVVDESNGADYGHQDYYTIRPSLIMRPTDWLENYVMYQFSRSRIIDRPQVLEDFNFSSAAQFPLLGTEALFNGGSMAAFDALRDQILGQQEKLGLYKIAGVSARCPSNDPLPYPVPITGPGPDTSCPGAAWRETNMLVNQTKVQLADNLTVKNIFGLQWGRAYSGLQDYDLSYLLLVDSSGHDNRIKKLPNTWSDEIQLNAKLFDSLDLVTGAFFNKTVDNAGVAYQPLTVAPIEKALSTRATQQDSSVYAQGNLDLSHVVEGLKFTAGYRYSWDSVTSITTNLDPVTLAPISSIGGPDSPAGHAKFSQGSYTLSLQYQLSAGTMLYITNAKGYSSGGLQNVAGFEVYQPDSLNNLEGGIKSTFNLGAVRLRFNGSAYYGWYDNVKVQATGLATNPATGLTQPVVYTSNAAKALVRGFDIDTGATLPFGLDVGGFVSYNNDAYTSYPSLDPTTLQPLDLSDTPFALIPKWKWGLRANYDLPTSRKFGRVSISANYTRQTKMYANPRPKTPTTPGNPNTGLICTRQRTAANGYGPLSADGGTSWIDCTPPQENLDIAVTWADPLGAVGWTASVVINNVTQNTASIVNPLDSSLGFTTAFVPLPRTATFTLGYKF